MSEGHSPLDQFKIHKIFELPPLFGYDVSFTNSSLMMLIAVTLGFIVLVVGAGRRQLVPGRLQGMAEVLYEFIATTLKENAGKEGLKYAPFVLTLFIFILFTNLLGLIPYSFTVTSHITITFAMAAFIFIAVTLLGFARHGIKFLGLFVPHGTPLLLAPMLFLIELFSYLSRPISLSLRLAANMMAGHILLKIIAGFVVMMGVFGVLPLGLLIALIGLELFVALLQAYIFTVLTCVYLNDALHLH